MEYVFSLHALISHLIPTIIIVALMEAWLILTSKNQAKLERLTIAIVVGLPAIALYWLIVMTLPYATDFLRISRTAMALVFALTLPGTIITGGKFAVYSRIGYAINKKQAAALLAINILAPLLTCLLIIVSLAPFAGTDVD